MALGLWQIAAVVRYSSGIAAGMSRDAAATQRAAIAQQVLRGEITKNQAAIERYNLQQQQAALGMQRRGGLIAGALAVGGAAAIVASVAGAARLQMAMTTVGAATGATTEQLALMQRQVLSLSDVTAQSAQTIAQEMATAAKAGLNSFQRLYAAFPQIAKFADVQYFAARASGRDLSPVEAVNYAVQFSHLFQAYHGARLQYMLDMLNKAMFMQPEGIQRLLFQGKYFIPLFQALGLNAQSPQGIKEMMTLLIAMGQTGFLRGRGGTSIENAIFGAINAVTMTGHLQGAKTGALRQLGILDSSGRDVVVSHGKLDWQKFTSTLSEASRRLSPAAFASDLKAAFNMQASQFLSVMNSPAFRQQFSFIQARLDKLGNVEDFFNKFFNNLIPQVQRAFTNLYNLGIAIFLPILPALTADFKRLADGLQAAGDYVANHPVVGKGIAWGLIATTAGLAATAISGLIGGFLRFSPLIRGVGLLIARVAPLLGELSFDSIPFVGWIAAIVTAIVMLVPAFNRVVSNLPEAIGRFLAMLSRNETVISAAIGFYLGRVTSIVVNGIVTMVKAIAAQAEAAVQNLWLLATPWGQAEFAARMQAAYAAAMRGATAQSNLFAPGFMAGYGSPMSFQQYWNFVRSHGGGGAQTTIHVHRGAINVNGASNPQATARALFEYLADPRSSLYSSGSTTRTHRSLPKALTVLPST